MCEISLFSKILKTFEIGIPDGHSTISTYYILSMYDTQKFFQLTALKLRTGENTEGLK